MLYHVSLLVLVYSQTQPSCTLVCVEHLKNIPNASFKLTLFGCVISICCVGFASLDVVCDELNDCA